jgi:hypothetical protein
MATNTNTPYKNWFIGTKSRFTFHKRRVPHKIFEGMTFVIIGHHQCEQAISQKLYDYGKIKFFNVIIYVCKIFLGLNNNLFSSNNNLYKGATVLTMGDIQNNNVNTYIDYCLYPSRINIQTKNRKAVTIEWVVCYIF